MKLLLCTKCSSIFSLSVGKEKSCDCNLSSGKYIDTLNAEISGPCMPIGFKNSSFISSLKMILAENKVQVEPTCCSGVDFTAFFIHDCSTSIKRIEK